MWNRVEWVGKNWRDWRGEWTGIDLTRTQTSFEIRIGVNQYTKKIG